MKLVYSGAHPEVYVPEHEDECPALSCVRQGEPVEVPDHIAEKLIEQSVWNPVVVAAPAPSRPPGAAQPAKAANSTPGA